MDILLGLLGIISFVYSYFSKDNKIIGIIIGFTLFILIFLSEQNQKIKELVFEQKRYEEKLKIYGLLNNMQNNLNLELKNIKADIKALQENEKRK